MSLQHTITGYLEHLRVERALSPHSVIAYQRDLALLIKHAKRLALGHWRELSSEALRGFIAQQHKRGLAPKSLHRLLSACRNFFRYLAREGELKANPADGLRAPKAPRKLPQVLDTDEASAFVAIQATSAIGVRDRALLELFYSSGLRLSELIGLRWGDLDREQGLVRVTGKGNKMRIVPVGSFALKALDALRAQAPATADMPIFLSNRGTSLNPRSVQMRIKHWGLAQGISKRVHPHLLRHSFASHMLESSGDLRAVQELLGHADIGTTQIYTHLDFQHLAKVYDAAHPRARRKSR